ncbi:hypothetical protein PHYSODRAFT_295227 [Phytophthora sojae]|uniref:Uncharacterized protein n=1 Tax=Phytophthora sojae (strain P6497) TaxID=1094619 RepID=G4YQQ3_PHYSP|nr:hypothetical protein PHYSODRAFT_295227 [Phytophthora sojae]EGZ30424.1 hypothetical protein PHYSODRAFT_295227 [Phytophthora sojae]|eukprot:XP_009517699.1 hypothetical protein PHYSODRAFT_295227 [Phytophthora sojae]
MLDSELHLIQKCSSNNSELHIIEKCSSNRIPKHLKCYCSERCCGEISKIISLNFNTPLASEHRSCGISFCNLTEARLILMASSGSPKESIASRLGSAGEPEKEATQVELDLAVQAVAGTWSNPTPQQHRLNKKGCVQLHFAVPEELCDRLRKAALVIPAKEWQHLFGKNGMDKLLDFFPDSEPRKMIFIKSLPGGDEQPAHRDYSAIPANEDLYDYTRLPGSVIVAIDDGSFIYGYGWNRQLAMESEKEKIQIQKGNVLLFGADFIHGGGDYKKLNIRVHFSLDPRHLDGRIVRKDNSVDLIRVIPKKLPLNEKAATECDVFGYNKQFPSAPAMRKHRRSKHRFLYKNYPTTITQPPRAKDTKRAGKTGTPPPKRRATSSQGNPDSGLERSSVGGVEKSRTPDEFEEKAPVPARIASDSGKRKTARKKAVGKHQPKASVSSGTTQNSINRKKNESIQTFTDTLNDLHRASSSDVREIAKWLVTSLHELLGPSGSIGRSVWRDSQLDM